MPRTVPVLLSFAAFCLIAGSVASTQAQELAAIPSHFFSEWSVNRDCSERHAGPQGHVQTGLKFRVSSAALAADGQAFMLDVRTPEGESAPSWQNVRLEYRAGVRMTTLPADFDCTPGAETTSPFLAMGDYSTSAEPWYEYEHWVGVVDIHGQKHHLLIFPRQSKLRTDAVRAVIVIHDMDASDNVKLDHGGIIHTQ